MPTATDTPVLDLIADMTASSLEASSLSPRDLLIARLAALVAVDAPPFSYDLNIKAAVEVGISADDVRGVLAAVAPIVGTPKIVAATGNIARALAFEIEIAELEEEDD
jgi:alkylhydroperoxidase/carboxymuconolactone decarboxylase family protein YurZ